MAESRWLRHSISVGIFEFRRSIRSLWQEKARFGFTVFGLGTILLIGTALILLFADAIQGLGRIRLPNQLRGTVALFWLFDVFIVGQRVASVRARIEAEPLILTAISSRAAAGGLVVAEILRGLAYVGPFALVLIGTSVLLLGSPLSLVFVPIAVLLFITTAVIVGTACGYGVVWLTTTSRYVARHRTVFGIAAVLILMGVYFLFLYTPFGIVNQTSLAWLPIAWLLDLATIGSPFISSSVRAGCALICSILIIVIGASIIDREVLALWFTEPTTSDITSEVREG